MCVLPAYMYAYHVCVWFPWMTESLELELWMVGIHHDHNTGTRIKNGSSERPTSVLSHRATS